MRPDPNLCPSLEVIRARNATHTLRCSANLRHCSDQLRLFRPLTIGEIAMIETAASQLQLLNDDVAALLAEVERLRERGADEWQPGRWFRIVRPDGVLWMETSDGDEARAEAQKTGWPLEREWVLHIEEMRAE